MTPSPQHLETRRRLAERHPAKYGHLAGGGDTAVSQSAVKSRAAAANRGRCAYLGDLVERVAGCNGGPRCRFECDHPNPAKRVALPTLVRPGFECQQCPHWSSFADPAEVPPETR